MQKIVLHHVELKNRYYVQLNFQKVDLQKGASDEYTAPKHRKDNLLQSMELPQWNILLENLNMA